MKAVRSCTYWVSYNNGWMPNGNYTFDENGRMTDPPEDALTEAAAVYSNGVSTYDTGTERTLLSTTTIQYSYVYNGGQLVQMTVDTTTDSETATRDTLYFAYDAAGSPMSVTYNDTVYYYATNLQGDIVAILDTTGTAVVQYSYDAWGNPLSTTGTLASTLGEATPLRYRGYVYDTEADLYYLQSRYYDPEIGRFINADALVSTGYGILGNNMFAYCNNGPVSYVDNSGNIPRPFAYISDNDEEQEEQEERSVRTTTKPHQFKRGQPGVARMSASSLGNLASYGANRELSYGTGYQVHHLIEFRWSTAIGMPETFTNYRLAPSVIITTDMHQEITNKARGAFPYGNTSYATTNAKDAIKYYFDLYRSMGKIDWVKYIESFFE